MKKTKEKVIINEKEAQAFKPEIIASMWILENAGYENFVFTKDPVVEDDSIIKLGFNETLTEIRYNNVAYGTAGDCWRKYGEKISKKWVDSERKAYLLSKRFDKQVIESFDREEQGVNCVCNTVGTAIRSFALTNSEKKEEMDWKESIEDAIEWLDRYFINEIAHIRATIF